MTDIARDAEEQNEPMRVKRASSLHKSPSVVPSLSPSKDVSKWIENYLVKETIGKGCFGKVKLGICKASGDKVALKLIDHKKLSNLKLAEKFRREIDVMRKIEHPNIVKLLDVIESPENDFTCLVFEFLSGMDLLEYVMKQPESRLDEYRTAKIFFQIVNAVSYLHENGIAHRDLKLENVMISEEEEFSVRLIDFGLSTFQGTSLLSTPCGSPTYAAPEILHREPYQGNKVDVWSLGVILYSMLAGNVPWEGKNDIERVANAKVGNWLPDKALSTEVTGLLERCFTLDPDFRADISDVAGHPWITNALINKEGAGRKIQKLIKRLSSSFFERATIRTV